MDEMYRAYLELLESLRENLAQLTELAQLKMAAAHHDDLLALNEVLRQEQASSLTFRGLELKREKQMTALGIHDLALSELPECFPEALRAEAQKTVDALHGAYRSYRAAAEEARRALEHEIQEIDQHLRSLGVDPEEEGNVGYAARQAETPPSMKTDFRA